MSTQLPPHLSRPSASTSVLAAGIVAIIGGAFSAFSILAAFLFLTLSGLGLPSAAALTPEMRPILYGTWIFFLLCSTFVIATGIGVIRLRNWARIALLVIAGCMLFFGLIGIGVIFFTIFLAPVEAGVSKAVLAAVLAFIYGIPILIALWWLILFTRPAITAQFQAAFAVAAPLAAGPGSRSFLNNPQCPLPVRIVAWYLASFVLVLPFLPFLPFRIPAYYFGHMFRGPAASLILFFNFALLGGAGLGLLLLKRWSLPLTLAIQLLFCINDLYAALSPSFESMMRAAMEEMNLPDLPYFTQSMLTNMRYFNLLGLVIPIAIIVTLLISRQSFNSAAAAVSADLGSGGNVSP
jgi:hypothetical protein